MKLSQIPDCFSRFNVAVLGDLMLDTYVWGRATRISQEAPVPVIAVNRQNAVPGGAANVVRNILSLGARSEAFGFVGQDINGESLLKLLNEDKASTQSVIRLKNYQTTVKTRILAGNQQVVRVDYETTDNFSASNQKRLLDALEKRLSTGEVHAVILEDYAKGLFTRQTMAKAVAIAQKYNVMTTLDPHPTHPFNVKGLTIMTPNRSEAFTLADAKQTAPLSNVFEDKPLLAVGKKILEKWAPKYLLITLGAEGMLLFDRDNTTQPPVHIPTRARQVFDVSGAGDTVMATIVLALLAGASVADAATVANAAAGVVVGRVGTSAIEADVLKRELSAE